MQPRIQLVFWVAKVYGWLISSSPSTVTPGFFLAGLLSILSFPQLVLVMRVASTQVQDLAFGFVEAHEV